MNDKIFNWIIYTKREEERYMKKRLLALLLTGTMVMTLLAGCGSESNTETVATSQVQEETVVEDAETPSETIIEETTVEEVENTVEETTESIEETTVEEKEVVEAEPMTFERTNFKLRTCFTNFGDDYPSTQNEYRVYNNGNSFNTNDYIDIDIMTELSNRGYDISNFVVTWMVAENNSGICKTENYSCSFSKFEDTDEPLVKLYPIFIKYDGVDTTKLIYNFNKDKEDLLNYKLTGTDNDGAVWYKIHEEVVKMKSDENYEEIDFKIRESYFKSNVEESIHKYLETDTVEIKDLTLNDWYNGMIYAMFESKTVDLDGLFDFASLN